MGMNSRDSIPIVDLFALPRDPFRIVVSAEIDTHARAVLTQQILHRSRS